MVISDDQKIADIFIEYFDVIVPKLGLAIPKNAIFAINGFEELKALYKYQRCPSILALKEKYKDQLSLSNLQSELKNLDSNIPTKVLKDNMDTSSPFLLNYFNDIINSSSFQNHLKSANTTAVHKKTHVMIYPPVSVLSNISEVFENIFNQQISAHFENIFSKQKFGFR